MKTTEERDAWSRATSGIHEDAHVPRGVTLAFLVLALAVVLVPSVGMLWAPTQTTTENRELAELPALVGADGSLNSAFLADFGTYFDDHFAYRNEAVTANARLRALLGTSATDQVVLGRDGWLFYGGTLPDYLGQSELSDRSFANIAHNLKLAQGYVESRGATFAFTLAPNKNSLDGSDMPYYYLRYDDASNAERLAPVLEQAGVNYVNLFSLFEGDMEEGGAFHYLQQDSHWDNVWALEATNELLEALGRESIPVDAAAAEVRDDFRGDLASMLFPAEDDREENYYFEGYNDLTGNRGATWEYVEGSDVTDGWIRTESTVGRSVGDADVDAGSDEGADADADADGGVDSDASADARSEQGSLLMFRDSFGNALVPLWAGSFERAAFSKMVPYNLGALSQVDADTVVIERAERHLSYLASDPPLMPSPSVSFANGLPSGAREVEAQTEISIDGPYWKIEGIAAEQLSADARLYVSVRMPDGNVVYYDPFWTSVFTDSDETSSDSGFAVLVPDTSLDLANAEVTLYAL